MDDGFLRGWRSLTPCKDAACRHPVLLREACAGRPAFPLSFHLQYTKIDVFPHNMSTGNMKSVFIERHPVNYFGIYSIIFIMLKEIHADINMKFQLDNIYDNADARPS
ncbi:hypothetical protein [Rhizobium sp. LCM 4573]|uniref:hypothetical protein n=1 Tax=Rhizobium sp. LCM 4573 TaxID=1848291 RepID=UPI0008D9EE21|nr:hypothetical protein [Rhizobium sp. LCM 4573]OHV77051.1 hypothetical protein LCM4573_09725 [Rhizobium sp. LCM 4573]